MVIQGRDWAGGAEESLSGCDGRWIANKKAWYEHYEVTLLLCTLQFLSNTVECTTDDQQLILRGADGSFGISQFVTGRNARVCAVLEIFVGISALHGEPGIKYPDPFCSMLL